MHFNVFFQLNKTWSKIKFEQLAGNKSSNFTMESEFALPKI